MNQIDQHKLVFVLKDCTQRLQFIGTLTRDNDISSELAGYEQSKLLTDQQHLEETYAKLVGLRSTLLGITNRTQLHQTQDQIKQVAKNLKESTKKLCRLFKENPNIDADSIKVNKERADLIFEFENLISLIQNNQLNKFAQTVTNSLEEQDSLRKFAAREKELIAEIKRLQNEKNQEFNEYKHEQEEKQKNIQALKEKLLYKTNRAEQKKKYDEKVAGAFENTQQRVFEYKQKNLEADIQHYNQKIQNEELVHKELKDYLIRKEEETKKKTDEQNTIAERQRETLEKQIEDLNAYRTKMLEELNILKQRFDREQIEQQERERKELEEKQLKARQELYQIKLENAIKLIQNELMERKELYGLGAKKKKPKKK
ncbi:hypothetical protein pb186bvf_019231 [Paramecium bursaria]